MSRFSTYYRLTKPGIIYGNALTAVGGYFYGAGLSPNATEFLGMLVGVCLVMASACVVNNVIDRDIDRHMSRTKKRAIVSGEVDVKAALAFAITLLLLGVVTLYVLTNLLTVTVALFGFVAYTVLYTYSKRFTVHSTLIGTLSGSTPPVIGYLAAIGKLDVTASLLFLVLVAWQMAHFYSIAIFRRSEYEAAKIPILSVVHGVKATRNQIIVYVLLYIASCVLLGLYGGASLLLTLILILGGAYWLLLCLRSPETEDYIPWARQQFGWSLWLLILMSVGWSLNGFWL